MYVLIMDVFTDENITEPLMHYYNDFGYVNYILNLEFEEGYKLFKKCIDRINEKAEEESKKKYWDLWLVQIQGGYEKSFQDFYKEQTKKAEIDSMDKKTRESEEQRILNKYSKKHNRKNNNIIAGT